MIFVYSVFLRKLCWIAVVLMTAPLWAQSLEMRLWHALHPDNSEADAYKRYLHSDSLVQQYLDHYKELHYEINTPVIAHDLLQTVQQAQNIEPAALFADSPFVISIDGKVLNEDTVANPDRIEDLALHAADIEVRFDSMQIERRLAPLFYGRETEGYRLGAYSNYPDFIDRYELRLFAKSQSMAQPIHIVEQAEAGGFFLDKTLLEPYEYEPLYAVVRVYDASGDFDETQPVRFDHTASVESPYANYGQSNIGRQSINIEGGTITVSGSGFTPDQQLFVGDFPAPLDGLGNFVSQLIMPNGQHTLAVRQQDDAGQETVWHKDVEIKRNDLFLFALGDLTLGRNDFSGPLRVEKANPEEFEEEYVYGRAAMFLKGKILGQYLITAAADTGEGEIEDIFKSLDDKDVRSMIRRIDADRYYPVYGDDSTIEDTAPTQGRVYVKIERGPSYAVWGSFNADIQDNDLTHINRTLYGGKFKRVSRHTTSYGEHENEVMAFFADPSTFPVHDEFRGTGGSVYFLNYQDITIGSERVRMEVRDRFSGIVQEVKELVYGIDYDIDYIKGRILLSHPLSAYASDGDIISSAGAELGNPAFLIADYETTPTQSSIRDNHILGGHLGHWLNDYIKIGFSGTAENSTNGLADRRIYGANTILRYAPDTYIKAGITNSTGGSDISFRSEDGGFHSNSNKIDSDDTAMAIDIEAQMQLADIQEGQDGKLNAYYRKREAGFAGQGYATNSEVEQYGGALEYPVGEHVKLRGEADIVQTDSIMHQRYMLEGGYDGETFYAAGALEYVDDETGNELLTAGAKVGRHFNAGRDTAYLFAQTTLDKAGTVDDNDRYGVGGSVSVTDKLAVGGEFGLTEDGDLSAKIQADFQVNDHSSTYINYGLTSDHSGVPSGFVASPSPADRGVLSFGGKTRYRSDVQLYAEENLYHGNGNSGLTHAYGVDFAPDDHWHFSASTEFGEVNDFERDAYAASVGYSHEMGHVKVAGEYRSEKANASALEVETYVMRANSRMDLNQDVALLARANASFSEDNDQNIESGEFVEASVGLAYRPTQHDKLNMLARYNYYYDLASNGQINSGTAENFKQKSHIFSIDAIYDVNRYVSLGMKYGFKLGEVHVPGLGWIENNTYLAVARLDYHITKHIDAMLEGRILYQDSTDTAQEGLLTGLYYRVNDHVKLGAGYSWSEFSDDLTSTNNYDNSGYFINVISKF